MKPRAALALALAAGLPGSLAAQEHVLVHYSWEEVFAGTIVPAAGPLAGNSAVDSGEGARIRIGVTALINGTNAVGQTITYTNPAPGGIGTVKGLGIISYELAGDNGAASAAGSWPPSGPGFQTVNFPPFNSGPSPPSVQSGGAVIGEIGGAQFTPPGGTANPTNNNVHMFRGVWTPNSYAQRSVNWRARPSSLVPLGLHSAVIMSYGIGTMINPTTGQPFNFDQFVHRYIGSDFGQGLNIPIVPAPASLSLLVLSAFMTRPPRRPQP